MKDKAFFQVMEAYITTQTIGVSFCLSAAPSFGVGLTWMHRGIALESIDVADAEHAPGCIDCIRKSVTLLKALTGKMENGRGERAIVLGLGWDPFPDRLILEQLRVVSMIV